MSWGLSRNDAVVPNADESVDTLQPPVSPEIAIPSAPPGTIEGALAGAAGGAAIGRAIGGARATGVSALFGAVAGAIVGNVVAETRRHLNVTQRTLARMVGFSERSIAQWEGQGLPTSTQQDRSRRFVEMRRLFDALCRVLPRDQIGQWLDRPNDEFDGATPLQIIENGQIDRIYTLIFYAESGTPG